MITSCGGQQELWVVQRTDQQVPKGQGSRGAMQSSQSKGWLESLAPDVLGTSAGVLGRAAEVAI